MQTHLLRLHYSGLLADDGLMDASQAEKADAVVMSLDELTITACRVEQTIRRIAYCLSEE